MSKITFNTIEKLILKRRKGLDTQTIASNSELLSIETEFQKSFFRRDQKISLIDLCEKIRKEYPTLQESKKD